MRERLLRRPALPLVLLAAWLLATAWLRPLAIPDEGRYVGVAWSMLTSGDWLVPRLDGLPYFHKPPLFYWITATALSVFGPGEWAARAAPILGAFTGGAALFVFMRRWRGDPAARWSLLAFATQPLVFLGGQFANLDMLVAGCIGASVLGFAHAALSEEHGRRSRGGLAAGYLFAALGTLAKGLIGFVLPGMILVAWLLLRGRWRTLLRLAWLPGVLLFLAVAGPWFFAMQQRFPEFFHYFFVVQHFARFAQGGFNNQQPFWFFPVVLAVLALPWSAWLLRSLRLPQGASARSVALLAWAWLAVVLLFFSLPRSKLVGYILPATLPLALLAGEAMVRLRHAPRVQRWWRASAGAAVLASFGAVVAGTVWNHQSARELGRALQPLAAPGERLVFLHAYYFDLPFYARWRGTVEVVEDWDDPALTARDNWRKELADAGRFDPELARQLLRLPSDVPAAHCGLAPLWVVGRRPMDQRYPLLRDARVVAVQRDLVLWQVPPRGLKAPECGGTPSANPADTS
jgi:4-amino-4-deoxy-L-arabinose transferase-like glycosyltransferase